MFLTKCRRTLGSRVPQRVREHSECTSGQGSPWRSGRKSPGLQSRGVLREPTCPGQWALAPPRAWCGAARTPGASDPAGGPASEGSRPRGGVSEPRGPWSLRGRGDGHGTTVRHHCGLNAGRGVPQTARGTGGLWRPQHRPQALPQALPQAPLDFCAQARARSQYRAGGAGRGDHGGSAQARPAPRRAVGGQIGGSRLSGGRP